MTKGAQKQPARGSDRIRWGGAQETIEFAHKRDKRRKANKHAAQARRKGRK